MPNRGLPTVLHHVQKLVAAEQADSLADHELLQCFRTNRDEAAFTALVQRHAPLVLGVCRRVLKREQDAENACQASLLVLARSAASIRKRTSLASWLYGVAYRLSRKIKTADTRRRVREGQARRTQQSSPDKEASWREVQAALDEELMALPEKFRAPLVLCYLDEQTRDEAARPNGRFVVVIIRWSAYRVEAQTFCFLARLNMTIFASAVVITLLFALPGNVFALGTETFGNAPAVEQPEWAKGVIDVVNLKSRVYSKWVNGNENFYYRGNAQALTEALRKFAEVKAEIRHLILLPGSGKTQSFDRKPIDFDWQLHVPSGIYLAVSKRKHAVMTVYVSAAKPRPLERKLVEKWLDELSSDSFRIRESANQELQKLGNDAKPFLRAALQRVTDLETRRRMEALLERLRGFDVTDLEMPKGITMVRVDDLLAVRLKELKDPDSTVCGMAVQDLTILARYSDKIVPAMIDMLEKDKHEWVRRVAAGCLSHLGVQGKTALPMLKKGLDDQDANIRNTFQAALESLENAKDEAGLAERITRERAILKEISQLKH
ncbi:MAG: HEAT repeat domain-containing protein [Gemmataceae bacterium]|nr:HEAT repeat domain-containing protein [Gemmataceae bacterium]